MRPTRRFSAHLVAGAALLLLAQARASADLGSGLFEPCRACHSLDPAAAVMAGPNLSGLIGRRIAGDARFDYSPVLRQAAVTGDVWSVERLDRFLADPEAMFRGMWMTSPRMESAADRKALVDFLADPKSR